MIAAIAADQNDRRLKEQSKILSLVYAVIAELKCHHLFLPYLLRKKMTGAERYDAKQILVCIQSTKPKCQPDLIVSNENEKRIPTLFS